MKKEILAAISSATGKDEILTRLAALEHKLFVLDHFSNGARAVYVGDNRVLMKAIVAGNQIAFYVEANDRLLSPWFIVSGAYETDLTNYFVRSLKPDSHCLDIGANFGYFTCLMGRFCPQGRVIGVEPDPHVFEIARDNVFINGLQNFTTVLHAAANDTGAEITLHRRKTRSGNTSIAKMTDDYVKAMGETSSEAFDAAGVRIDDLLGKMDGRIDFIKIDVEGAEPLVFAGAKETIAACRDLNIVFEWSPGQVVSAGFDVPAFTESLKALGLTPYDITPTTTQQLSYQELLNIPYRAGVLLRRH